MWPSFSLQLTACNAFCHFNNKFKPHHEPPLLHAAPVSLIFLAQVQPFCTCYFLLSFKATNFLCVSSSLWNWKFYFPRFCNIMVITLITVLLWSLICKPNSIFCVLLTCCEFFWLCYVDSSAKLNTCLRDLTNYATIVLVFNNFGSFRCLIVVKMTRWKTRGNHVTRSQ